MIHAIRISILLSFLGLTSCSWLGIPQFNSSSPHQQVDSAQHYLQLALTSSGPEAQEYQILAAERLIQDGMDQRAKEVIDELDQTSLTEQQHDRLKIVQAKIALNNREIQTTINLLASVINVDQLPLPLQSRYHEILAQAYFIAGNPVASVYQRVLLESLLTEPQKRIQNEQTIWNNLQRVSTSNLLALQKSPPPDPVSGWLALAYVAKSKYKNNQELVNAVDTWRQQYPNHPGNSLLPSQPEVTSSAITSEPQHIALLLPLSGTLAAAGTAVRDGFLTAYYQPQNPHNLEVKIYNTAQDKPITQLYQEAVADGAEAVIGPLSKNEVTEIMNLPKNQLVPTLTLNYAEPINDAEMPIYQFGLSPQDEANAITEQANYDGHHSALLITPSGSWGDEIAHTISQRWLELGGEIVGSMQFDSSKLISPQVANLLNIDQSQARFNRLTRLLQDKIKFIARRRQDPDVIFAIAQPTEGREIIPSLKFYFADNLAIYSTSHIYGGTPDPHADKDLNEIFFCDMPWVLNLDPSLNNNYRSIKTLWPKKFTQYNRLYALGNDAFQLTNQLGRLRLFPAFGISGATGTLYLDPEHRVIRKLQWAQMRNGRPNLV